MVGGAPALELCLVTADSGLAAHAERAGVERVLVDLETIGKAERQAGQDLFLSPHTVDDVGRLSGVLSKARLMVRTNPLHPGSPVEVREALGAGADILMLPMTRSADDARRLVDLVDGRADVSILVENASALDALPAIVQVSGVSEIHVGLNDLRLSLGLGSLFDPLVVGVVDRVANVVSDAGLRFGFGGVASPDDTMLPVRPELIIGEHVRLGSRLAWLGRSFRRAVESDPTGRRLQADVDAIRTCWRAWSARTRADLEENRQVLARELAARSMASPAP